MRKWRLKDVTRFAESQPATYKGRLQTQDSKVPNSILFQHGVPTVSALLERGSEGWRCLIGFGEENEGDHWRIKLVKWQSHFVAQLKTQLPPMFYQTPPSLPSPLPVSVWFELCEEAASPSTCRVLQGGLLRQSCLLQFEKHEPASQPLLDLAKNSHISRLLHLQVPLLGILFIQVFTCLPHDIFRVCVQMSHHLWSLPIAT